MSTLLLSHKACLDHVTPPGQAFQVAPRPDECDPTVPQTPHSSGMLCLFFDGSVRNT